jgi:hypothetical protein
MNNEMEYIKKTENTDKVIRTEILFTPLLIILPMFVGLLFIYDWYNRGFLEGNSDYFGTLLLGIIILIINIIFDIPFIKSLRNLTKKKKENQ